MDNSFLNFVDHIYVPKSSILQKELLSECHDLLRQATQGLKDNGMVGMKLLLGMYEARFGRIYSNLCCVPTRQGKH